MSEIYGAPTQNTIVSDTPNRLTDSQTTESLSRADNAMRQYRLAELLGEYGDDVSEAVRAILEKKAGGQPLKYYEDMMLRERKLELKQRSGTELSPEEEEDLHFASIDNINP